MFRTPEKLPAQWKWQFSESAGGRDFTPRRGKENKDANKYSPSAYYVLEGLENIILFNPHYKNT